MIENRDCGIMINKNYLYFCRPTFLLLSHILSSLLLISSAMFLYICRLFFYFISWFCNNNRPWNCYKLKNPIGLVTFRKALSFVCSSNSTNKNHFGFIFFIFFAWNTLNLSFIGFQSRLHRCWIWWRKYSTVVFVSDFFFQIALLYSKTILSGETSYSFIN